MKLKVLGWIVFTWGLAGIILNVVFVSTQGAPNEDFILQFILNSFVGIGFIYVGWRLAHRKRNDNQEEVPR